MDKHELDKIIHADIPENIPTGDMPGDIINITPEAVETLDFNFACSDHNPVRMTFTLEKSPNN